MPDTEGSAVSALDSAAPIPDGYSKETEGQETAHEPVFGPLEDELFGKRIRKSFGSRAFWGTVVDSYVVGKGLFYKVSFDDGDVDILSVDEVRLDMKEAERHRQEDVMEKEPEAEKTSQLEPYSDVLRTKKASLKRRRDSSAPDHDEHGGPSRVSPPVVLPWRVTLWSMRLFATIMEEDGYIRVQNFVPMPGGGKGEMESTSKVKPGDALLAVEGQIVHGTMDHIQACELIRALPRPLTLTFIRPVTLSHRSMEIVEAVKNLQSAPSKKTKNNESEASTQVTHTLAAPPSQRGIPQGPPTLSTHNRFAPAGRSRTPSPSSEVVVVDPSAVSSNGQAQLQRHQQPPNGAFPPPGYPRAPTPPVGMSTTNGSTTASVAHPHMVSTSHQIDPRVSRAPGQGLAFVVRPLGSSRPPSMAASHPAQASRLARQHQYQLATSSHPQASFSSAHPPSCQPAAYRDMSRQMTFSATQPGPPTYQHVRLDSTHGFRASSTSVPNLHGQATSFRPDMIRRYEHAVMAPSVSSRGAPLTHDRNAQLNPYAHRTQANTSHRAPNPANAVQITRVPAPQEVHSAAPGVSIARSEDHGKTRGGDAQSSTNGLPLGRRRLEDHHADTPLRANMTLGEYVELAYQQKNQLEKSARTHQSSTQPSLVGSRSTLVSEPRKTPNDEGGPTPREPSPPRSESPPPLRGSETSFLRINDLQRAEVDDDIESTGTSFLSLHKPSFVEKIAAAGKAASSASTAVSGRSRATLPTRTQRPRYLDAYHVDDIVEVTVRKQRLYLTLGAMGQFVSVSSFVRGTLGEIGEIESSGLVLPGDILVGVGPVEIPLRMVPGDVAQIVMSQPRPYAAYFRRPTWEMLQD